ncbi:hypothetical protein F4805DRAFT_468505 [Annulohypoxylon moriforme]|nr:hypothetical protein F4805DRAFT_468505 [Annulohypoxylon moriforme]
MEPEQIFRSTQARILRSAGLEVLLPPDAEFAKSQESYWSLSARLSPACVVRPRSSQEVASAVRSLVTQRWKFALRSGGHATCAGASNIADGVTLDLSLMSWIRFNKTDNTVDIGPGARWKDVYTELDKHGRMVAGGREGNVGVGGLILGGGKTFLTARRGFACDNVVQFEVVLADGTIVAASLGQSDDLFWALKGGSNNFGVVTNFKMKTFDGGKVWGGINFYSKEVAGQAIQNVVDFTNNLHGTLDSNMLCLFTYMELKDVGVAFVGLQVDGDEDSLAYEPWHGLPSINSTFKTTTLSEFTSTPEHNLPLDYYNIFFTASFKNDTRIVTHAVELHEKLVLEFKDFIPDGDFSTQCIFQPLPTLYGTVSVAAGGNAMGLERQKSNGLLFLAVAMVRTKSQYDWAYPKIKAWLEAMKSFADTVEGGNLEFVYLNYADASQNPLGSYGEGNLRRLKEVAAKYDPEQVFQTLCPGGFKVSKVN